MKPRQAAALALVGWYLLAPPVYVPKDSSPDLPLKSHTNENAPLAEWTNYGSFDSVSACEKERAKQLRQGSEMDPKYLKVPLFSAVKKSFGWATCIATYDPRLAK